MIVGGGPCGLAAAMMLAKEGYDRVDVIEKRKSVDYFEPDKAFVFSIDERGQKFMQMVGALDNLKANGVGTKNFVLSRLYPDGKVQRKELAIKDAEIAALNMPYYGKCASGRSWSSKAQRPQRAIARLYRICVWMSRSWIASPRCEVSSMSRASK